MHYFPGVRWDEWGSMPYETFMGCVAFVDSRIGNGEEE